MAEKHFVVRKGLSVSNTAPTVTVHITANDAILVPVGNTSQRPSGANGYLRYSNTSNAFEVYAAGEWKTLADTNQLLKVYDEANTQVFP